MPLIFSPPNRDDANLNEFVQGDKNKFRSSCFESIKFKEKMQTLLPHFDGLGLLDFKANL